MLTMINLQKLIMDDAQLCPPKIAVNATTNNEDGHVTVIYLGQNSGHLLAKVSFFFLCTTSCVNLITK